MAGPELNQISAQETGWLPPSVISHSGRTRSFDLSKLIASITARGDRSGEREPCTSYGLFGE